jgi:hypothetical protein
VFRNKVQLKLRHLVLGVICIGAALTAAPALSMNPYMPDPVDFEQRLPPVERLATPAPRAGAGDASPAHASPHPGEGPVSHQSAVLTAPQRFDLAGLARELRPYELRARENGGQWSDWIATANGDPVYFGGADEVQLRARGWRPEGRLHYVNVSGTTTEADGLLNGARSAINSAFISVASAIEPEAGAEPIRPDFVSRGEWGAKGKCTPRAKAGRGKVKSAVVHHTVTANDYEEDEAAAIVLGICRFHRNGNGWDDIGYNAVVDRFGNVYAGRAGGMGKAIVGAHAQGFNSQTTGISALGTHTSTPIGEESLNTFAEVIAWKLDHHGHEATGKTRLRSAGGSVNRYRAGKRVRKKRVIGHRHLNLTACPGESLKAQLREIRHRAQALIDGKPVKPPPPKAPTGGTGG